MVNSGWGQGAMPKNHSDEIDDLELKEEQTSWNMVLPPTGFN